MASIHPLVYGRQVARRLLIVIEELGLLRDDIDHAGQTFRRGLGMIVVHGQDEPKVCQVVANSAGREDVFAGDAKFVGALYGPIGIHTSPASDPQDAILSAILLNFQEDTHPRIGLDVASCQSPIGGAEPDVTVQVDEVQRIDARSSVTR